MWEPLLGWLEVIVAVTIIAAAGKSVYSGWLYRRILQPLNRIEKIGREVEQIKERQEEMSQRQQRQIDAVIALGRSHSGDAEFDQEAFREDVRDSHERPDDYLADD